MKITTKNVTIAWICILIPFILFLVNLGTKEPSVSEEKCDVNILNKATLDETIEICSPIIDKNKEIYDIEEQKIKEAKKIQSEVNNKNKKYREVVELKAKEYQDKFVEMGFHKVK